jgi:hypothetical protein
MADNHDNENQTVVEALGLSKKWADKNIDTLNNSFELQGTISELIVNLGLVTKEDQFGKLNDDAGSLSEYELKLLYSGYQVAKYMEKQGLRQFKESMNPFGGHPLLDMLKGLSGGGINGGVIQVRMDGDGNIESTSSRGDDAPGPIKDIIRDIIKGIKNRESKDSKDGDGDND